jgi:hypothetical protein
MELKRKALGDEAKAKAEGKGESLSGAKQDASVLSDRNEPRKSPPAQEEVISGNEAAGADVDSNVPDGGTVYQRLWHRSGRGLRFGVPTLCLVLAVAGFFFIKSRSHAALFANTSPRLEPVTSIMRPIPVPDYREMLDFLLAYEIDGHRMITAIRMEVGFQNPTRYQNFKDQNVIFRDTVYSFLSQQNLSRNTAKSWHSVLGKDLVDCLRVKLPQSYADTIQLTQVENL